MKLHITETGVAKAMPSRMGISCVFKECSKDASNSIVTLSEGVASYVSDITNLLGDRVIDVVKNKIITRDCHKTVEKSKGALTKITEKESIFSHYESSQTIYIESAIDLDMLILVLSRLVEDTMISSYYFNFDVSKKEREVLKESAIRNAYLKACQKAELFVELNKAKDYSIDFVDTNVNSGNHSRFCKEASILGETALVNNLTVVKENIDVKCIEIFESVDFNISIIK